jgi:hypothetical protein
MTNFSTIVSISTEEFNWILDAIKEYENTGKLQRLHEAVESLSQIQKQHLVGVFLLGRDEFHDWKEVFRWRIGNTNIVAYLSEKANLHTCLARGWTSIPDLAKVDTAEEYSESVRRASVQPTVTLLNEILDLVTEIDEATEEYLIATNVRPVIEDELLRLLYSAHVLSADAAASATVDVSRYQRKVESLQSNAMKAVRYWLMDHSNVAMSRSSPLSASEWIIEGFGSGLDGVRRHARVLIDEVQTNGISLVIGNPQQR